MDFESFWSSRTTKILVMTKWPLYSFRFGEVKLANSFQKLLFYYFASIFVTSLFHFLLHVKTLFFLLHLKNFFFYYFISKTTFFFTGIWTKKEWPRSWVKSVFVTFSRLVIYSNRTTVLIRVLVISHYGRENC